MNKLRTFALFTAALCGMGADWKIAEPGWPYAFPRDHHAHREFKTEWWYFTGHLLDEQGARWGYELTFFREGIRPPAQDDPQLSRFVVSDLKFAHFTITDAAGKRFQFNQKTSRGSFGEAGFDDADRIAWIDDWSLQITGADSFDVRATSGESSLQLHLRPKKPPVIHGENGISSKASGEGHASQYYSLTRLETSGELRASGKRHVVRGESWFDHEWATNQLGPGQIGWNWLCVQFADGTELMLYAMRLASGDIDPTSSGTFVLADGTSTHLSASAFTMKPLRFWKSKKTGADYPIEWRVTIPDRALDFTVKPWLDDQELVVPPLTYWEGAVEVSGAGPAGLGYLELTGYAGPLQGLQR